MFKVIYFYIVAPEIVLQLTDLLENETNPTQFTCQAIGVPVPSIEWYFNGTIINLSSNRSKYDSSSMLLNESIIESFLSVMNAQSSDVGRYTCQAENIIGTAQSLGVLTVNGIYIHILQNYVEITMYVCYCRCC